MNNETTKVYAAFLPVIEGVEVGVKDWEGRLLNLSEESRSAPRNVQDRNIRQIIGHMIDSASNNLHRVVHLQYWDSPLEFPNYATYGNNDRWIAIQNYEQEDWVLLIQHWKYSHLHLMHIIRNIKPEKLNNKWMGGPDETVSLELMVIDFLRHFQLHISEIEALINTR